MSESTIYTPLYDRVVIKRDKYEGIEPIKDPKGIIVGYARKNASGVLIPQPNLDPNTGVIVSVGDGVDEPRLKPGARVHWGRNAGTMIRPNYSQDANAEDLFICVDVDILGIFETKQGE